MNDDDHLRFDRHNRWNHFIITNRHLWAFLTDLWPPYEHTDEEDYTIPPQYVDDLAQATVTFIAELIQCYINAGSERDITYEDDDLYDTIRAHLNSWVHPKHRG